MAEFCPGCEYRRRTGRIRVPERTFHAVPGVLVDDIASTGRTMVETIAVDIMDVLARGEMPWPISHARRA